MNLKLLTKIFATISFLMGIMTVFFYWQLGATLIIVWLFLTGSVLTWLTDDSVPTGIDQKVEQAVKQTIAKGKKRAIIFAVVETIILILVWIK